MVKPEFASFPDRLIAKSILFFSWLITMLMISWLFGDIHFKNVKQPKVMWWT